MLRRQERGDLSAFVATAALAAKVVLVFMLSTGVLWPAAVAWADDTPSPAPTPTTTTPDAPPPDPYTAPAKPVPSKPKSTPRTSTQPTRSAPAAPVHHYTPPPVQSRSSTPTYSAPTHSTPTYRAPTHRAPPRVRTHRAVKKAAHKPRKHVAHRRPKPKPASVEVRLAPLAHVLAAANSPLPVLPSSRGGENDPYLWLAGLAFAVLAAAGLSLHLLSVRVFHARFE